MLPPSDDVVTIYERGGARARIVPVAQPSVAWELNDAGSFSAFVSLRALEAAGLERNLKGYWVEWESPAGRYGGVITGKPVTDGVAELASMGYAVLMRGRLMPPNFRPVPAPAGSILKRAIQYAIRDQPTFITSGVIDESGDFLDVELSNTDLYTDVLSTLSSNSGHEWRVSADRVLTFSRYVGRDRSNIVRLVEGRHIASYRVGDDMWMMANSLTGLSAEAEVDEREWMVPGAHATIIPRQKGVKNKKWIRTKKGPKWKVKPKPKETVWNPIDVPFSERIVDPFVAIGVENGGSIARYGPLEAVRTYADTRDRLTIKARLEAEMEILLNPAPPVELSLVDADGCYRAFEEGDIVWVDIGSADISGALRVIHRTYDSGGLVIAGDLRPVGMNVDA